MSFWQNFTLGFGSTQAQQSSTNNENTNAFDKRSKRPTESVETDKAHKRQALDDISNKKSAQGSSATTQAQKSLKSSSQQVTASTQSTQQNAQQASSKQNGTGMILLSLPANQASSQTQNVTLSAPTYTYTSQAQPQIKIQTQSSRKYENPDNNNVSKSAKPATKSDNDLMEVEGSSALDYIDIDAREKYCDVYCTSYAVDIFAFLKEREKKFRPVAYLEQQTDINSNMRSILVDWLVEVAEEYKLASDTLYLTIYYLDRYLTLKPVNRSKLQLLGIVCMLIASKFEEVYAPAVDEFVYISDSTYTKEEIFATEAMVLNTLSFNLSCPTAKTFLRRYLKAAGYETGEIAFLASYLSELSLLDLNFVKFLPSMVAAAAVSLALITCGQPWTNTLTHYTGLTWENAELQACIRDLHRAQVGGAQCPFQAIREKYSHSVFLKVSNLPPPASLPFLWRATTTCHPTIFQQQ